MNQKATARTSSLRGKLNKKIVFLPVDELVLPKHGGEDEAYMQVKAALENYRDWIVVAFAVEVIPMRSARGDLLSQERYIKLLEKLALREVLVYLLDVHQCQRFRQGGKKFRLGLEPRPTIQPVIQLLETTLHLYRPIAEALVVTDEVCSLKLANVHQLSFTAFLQGLNP